MPKSPKKPIKGGVKATEKEVNKWQKNNASFGKRKGK